MTLAALVLIGTFLLTTYTDAFITEVPRNAVVDDGASTSMTCAATGMYTWEFNGAASATCTTSNSACPVAASATTCGEYSCVETPTKRSASLVVVGALTCPDAITRAPAGTPFTLRCSAIVCSGSLDGYVTLGWKDSAGTLLTGTDANTATSVQNDYPYTLASGECTPFTCATVLDTALNITGNTEHDLVLPDYAGKSCEVLLCADDATIPTTEVSTTAGDAATTAATTVTTAADDSGLKDIHIMGIVVGAVAALIILGIIYLFLSRPEPALSSMMMMPQQSMAAGYPAYGQMMARPQVSPPMGGYTNYGYPDYYYPEYRRRPRRKPRSYFRRI